VTSAHHELDDVALLRAHRDGDPDAFGVLFTRHRDRLWAVALRTTGNPEDAADALQEARISAFRRAAGFRGDALVTTWLHRIVVNASLDRLRRNKVRAAQPLPDDLEEYAGRGAVLATGDASTDPEAQAVLTDRRDAVLTALDRLPPDQKAAVVLVDLEGYPVEQVAEMLECPTGTVKSRCARGRARLAVLLRESGLDGTTSASETSHPGNDPTPEQQGGARA
jgi:RNA polymerase sigma-70 factor (ECF subfamily)